MRNDFAIFILTHGRPREQKTYRSLIDAGYTGKVYFVIDDMDETADEYKRLYGDSVLVFDKEAEYEKTDTFSNEKQLTAVVFARNACFSIARQLGLRYFVNCDDDIKRFNLKFIKEKLITQKVTDFDAVIEALIRYMESSGIECCSIAEAGAFIGGVNNNVLSSWNWSFSHFFLFDSETDMRFRGLWYEDNRFSCDWQSVGRRMFSTLFVEQTLPSLKEADKQIGGMRDAYKTSNSYISAFSMVVAHPESIEVVFAKKDNCYKIRRKNDSMRPKILNERWKKRNE